MRTVNKFLGITKETYTFKKYWEQEPSYGLSFNFHFYDGWDYSEPGAPNTEDLKKSIRRTNCLWINFTWNREITMSLFKWKTKFKNNEQIS